MRGCHLKEKLDLKASAVQQQLWHTGGNSHHSLVNYEEILIVTEQQAVLTLGC